MSDEQNTDPQSVTETEQELVESAQRAVSQCNWVVGACASKWTERYARGRTDADFASLVGLSPDQVYQRRRVHETFSDVRDEYPTLKWSHFYVSLTWDDSAECLAWAQENEATVQEMRAWRKAIHGEDLDADADPEPDAFSGDPSVAWVPSEQVVVRDPGGVSEAGGESGSDVEGRSPAATVTMAARETDGGEEYAPFRKGAMTPPSAATPESTAETKPPASDEQVLKRIIVTLERVNKELTADRVAKLEDLPEKLRNRLIKAVSGISTKAAGLL